MRVYDICIYILVNAAIYPLVLCCLYFVVLLLWRRLLLLLFFLLLFLFFYLLLGLLFLFYFNLHNDFISLDDKIFTLNVPMPRPTTSLPPQEHPAQRARQ